MILVRLNGGLGNQMFQYSAGLALAQRHGVSLRLDKTFLDTLSQRGFTPRSYQLHRFHISGRVATPIELAEATGRPVATWWKILVRIRRKAGLSIPHPFLFTEAGFHFDRRFLNAPGHALLVGYWQSERYFEGIRNKVLREFQVRGVPSVKNRELADRIRGTESVAVHIRRGDYALDPATSRAHGICGPGYYTWCMEAMTRRVPGAKYYVFSDDPGWARKHLEFPPTAILAGHNPPEMGYEDLRLMALCRHHIIANSTFSWWGAWLCDNPSKVVFAPSRWFMDPSRDTSDLIPAGWNRV